MFSFESWLRNSLSQFSWCAECQCYSGNENQQRRSSFFCQDRERRRSTHTPTLQRYSLQSADFKILMMTVMMIIEMIIEVILVDHIERANQWYIKHIGSNDLPHTQLDPQWSLGRVGNGRSWGTGQSQCNIGDIDKVTLLSCSVLILHFLSSWPLNWTKSL